MIPFFISKRKVRRAIEEEWDRADEAWIEAFSEEELGDMGASHGGKTALYNVCSRLGIDHLFGRRVGIEEEAPFEYKAGSGDSD